MSTAESTWRSPGAPEPSEECVRLACALRELRSATGLSLARLAGRTPYSKSSWERYLNGKALPPRQAVLHLCTLAGERPQQQLALWELAESAWSGRADRRAETRHGLPHDDAGHRDGHGPLDPSPPRPTRRNGLALGILTGLTALAALILAFLEFAGARGDVRGEARAPAPVPSSAPVRAGSGPQPGCHADSCTGKEPEDSRCSTATAQPVTLAERRFGDGTVVRVRRSELCETVWARVDRGLKGDRVEISAPRTATQQTQVQDRFDEAASLSTPMTAAVDKNLGKVRACLVRQNQRRCFTATPPPPATPPSNGPA